jgi:hypothetical protein
MKVEALAEYRHVKSGAKVTVLDFATLQTGFPSHRLQDMQPMVIYEHNARLWVRSEEEFSDGRFEPWT